LSVGATAGTNSITRSAGSGGTKVVDPRTLRDSRIYGLDHHVVPVSEHWLRVG
jgi:hypothetical protein